MVRRARVIAREGELHRVSTARRCSETHAVGTGAAAVVLRAEVDVEVRRSRLGVGVGAAYRDGCRHRRARLKTREEIVEMSNPGPTFPR